MTLTETNYVIWNDELQHRGNALTTMSISFGTRTSGLFSNAKWSTAVSPSTQSLLVSISSHETSNYLNDRDLASLPTPDPSWLTTFKFITDGVVTNLLVVFGLIANFLTLIVLSRPNMRSSVNSYLSALAIWDSIVLACSGLLIGLPGLPAEWSTIEHYTTGGPFAYVVAYVYPLALIAQTATIWLTVSFAVERFIGVHYPLRAASLCTVQRARCVIMLVCLASFAYNITRWFEYRPTTTTITAGGNGTMRDVITVELTSLGESHTYQQVYFSWLYLPVMCIVPLVALSVVNVSLVLAVRRSRADRKLMNVRQSRENNVTIVLVTVVAVFIVCQVPALAYNVAYAVDNDHVMKSPGYRALSHLRNLLVNVNSAVNFLLYCAFGQKFRRVALATFCRGANCRDAIARSRPTSVCGLGHGYTSGDGGGGGGGSLRLNHIGNRNGGSGAEPEGGGDIIIENGGGIHNIVIDHRQHHVCSRSTHNAIAGATNNSLPLHCRLLTDRQFKPSSFV